mmetsp:Transcript_35988/g.95528  ORF Transcript_35988/g.95528 Transcript_35988/m.95528 type:complete len:136 (-) Transcript_35988:93-500(-)
MMKAMVLVSCWATSTALHYGPPPCGADEVQSQVRDTNQFYCAPLCPANQTCPTDKPDGTTAAPHCFVMDTANISYCALYCTSAYQCDQKNGARCSPLNMIVGACAYTEEASNVIIVPLRPAEKPQKSARKPTDLV